MQKFSFEKFMTLKCQMSSVPKKDIRMDRPSNFGANNVFSRNSSAMSTRYSGIRFPRSGYRSFYANRPLRRYKTKRYGVSKYRTRSNSTYGTFAKTRRPNPRAFISKELKYYDDNASIAGGLGQYATNWSSWYVPAIVRGTTSTTRVGDQIYAEWLNVKFQCNHTAAGAVNQRVRWMIIRTLEPYNAAPIPADIFTTPLMFSPNRNMDYTSGNIVLAEGQVILELQTHSAEVVEANVKLGFAIKFSGNGGVVGDISKNNITIVAWSDQAANPPQLANGTWRLTFRDM